MTMTLATVDQMEYATDAEARAAYGGNLPNWDTPAWLSGWGYRKCFTLSRASGAVTNYQMKLLVGESSGATGEAVDCGSHCKTDFSDLRFTTADGTTLLDYWIESVSGTTPNQLAAVWIEIDSIGTSATTFYMYYGKSDASTYSNGENTFPFFDHFDGDASKWSGDTVALSIASSVGTLTATTTAWKKIRGNVAAGANSLLIAKCKLKDAGYTMLAFAASTSNYADAVMVLAEPGSANRSKWATQNGGSETVIGNVSIGADSYHIYQLARYGTPKASGYVDSTPAGTPTTSNVTTSDLYASMLAYGNTNTVEVDWILQRHYVDGEPSWGTWGNEQIFGAPVVYSEPSIIKSGAYALKGIAAQTISLNKTLTRTLVTPIDLTGKTHFMGYIRSSRTGSNIKLGIHDSGGTTTEITPNITSADTWTLFDLDISGVSDVNKDAIDQIIITVVNADADNTFYLDNLFAVDDPVLAASKVVGYAVLSSIQPALNVSKLVGYVVLGPYVEPPPSDGGPMIWIF